MSMLPGSSSVQMPADHSDTRSSSLAACVSLHVQYYLSWNVMECYGHHGHPSLFGNPSTLATTTPCGGMTILKLEKL